ncbi:MAG: AI-2E family transporter [Bacillota bacterium]|jgi:predicted PurR-regulated permease PerM
MLRDFFRKMNPDRRVIFYILFGVASLAAMIYIKELYHGFLNLVDIFKPVVFGLIFAFVINVLMRFLENRVFAAAARKHPLFAKIKRPTALITAFVIIGAFASLFFIFVLPQFIASLRSLAEGLPDYAAQFADWANGLLVFYSLDTLMLKDIAQYTAKAMTAITSVLENAVPNIWGFTVNLASGIINIVFGLIFAIYMLAGKEKLIDALNRFIDCFFPEKFGLRARYFADVTNETCSRFIEGQCLDALCLGILSFIVLSIMRMPYALVIAVTLAMTNLIPVVGPWLGAIPCAVITFVISPFKAMILVITIVILQEVENKLIYPKIVGNRVGLDGIWVLIGVICGAKIGGLIGIILGVPVIAVIARLLGDRMKKRENEAESG